MPNDPRYHQLLEASWRRKLTPAEELELSAWLAAHPEAQADWELEVGLNEALERLPQAPQVSSNFTSRVLAAVELDLAAQDRLKKPSWRFWTHASRWLPRAAIAAMVVGAGLFSVHEIKVARRMELVRSLTAVSEVSSLLSPEILQDFDAICALNQNPPPDEQLLSLLQ